MIENVPSSPAAAHAAPESVIKNVAPSPVGRRRAKTVQELILEAETQTVLHEADVKAAASLQRLHWSAVQVLLSQHCWTVGLHEYEPPHNTTHNAHATCTTHATIHNNNTFPQQIHKTCNIQHATYVRREPTLPAVNSLGLGQRESCT